MGYPDPIFGLSVGGDEDSLYRRRIYETPGVPPLRPLPPLRLISLFPLESTLTKVYQNNQLYPPLESTLAKNPGKGGVIVN